MPSPQIGAVTNRVRMGIIREATFATIPATPAFQTLRPLSGALAGAARTAVSGELVSDRQVADLALVGKSVGGEIAVEYSLGSHDILLEAALFGAWTKTTEKDNRTASSITAVSASAYTTSTASPAWAQNMIVRASGFALAANNRTIVADTGSTGTNLAILGGGGAVEASPPATARLKRIGQQGASGDITATTTGLAATTLNFTTLGLAVGMWIRVGGPDVGNKFATCPNGWARISAIATGALTFDIKPTGWTTDAGAGKTIRLYWGDYVRNGVTEYSHTIEFAYLDSGQFQYFLGMVVQQMTLSAQSQQIVTGGFTFMGADNTLPGVSRTSGATDLAAWTSRVLNATSNVARIAENGTPIVSPNFITGLTLQVANGLREQVAVASLGPVGIGMGRSEISGTLTAYFGDNTLLQKVLQNTATSLDMTFTDADGLTVLIDLPLVKFTSGSAPVRGLNTDIMVDMGYQAIKHPTLGYQMHLQECEGAGT